MAARINTKVVVPLIVILLVVVGGVIGLAYFTIHRSPEFYKTRGDAAAAAGDWRTAEEFYSKGVNRDQGNIEMIDLWRNSILHIVPTDLVEAKEFYSESIGLIRRKRDIRSFEPQFHIDWLTLIFELSMPSPSLSDAAALATEAETMLTSKPVSDDNPLWEQAYRFRGIANAYRVQDVGLDKETHDQALEDLNRWLANHPDDSVAVDAKIKWHLFDARALANRSKSSEALARAELAISIAADYLKAHPDDALIQDCLAQSYAVQAAIAADIPGDHTDNTQQVEQAIGAAERLALQADDLPRWESRRIAGDILAWSGGDRPNGAARAASLIEQAQKTHPDDPQLQFDRAGYLAMAGQRAASREAYQQIIDAPTLPVSNECMTLYDKRPMAVEALFDMDIEAWRTTDRTKSDEIAAARAAAQSRIDQYRNLMPSTDPQLLYMEGRFALADQKPEVAANRLNQFLTTVGQVNLRAKNATQLLRTLYDLASALQQSNQSGAAYEYLADIDELSGGRNPDILRVMVSIDLAAQNLDRAQQVLDRLVALDPDNGQTKELRNRLAVLKNGADAGIKEDSTLSAMLQSHELQASGQVEEARTLLLNTLKNSPDDFRILYELAKLEQRRGQTDKALEYVGQALAKDPKSEPWRILQAVLSKADLHPVLDQIVDERSGLSEFDRHVAKWRLFAENGLTDDAKAEFEAAKKINPDAPAIIEQDFAMAMLANDMKAARDIVRRAQATNADLANGLTFRGRYELQNGDTAAAIATLLQATSLKPYDGSIWRFLGAAYREAGNNTAAMDALQKSLEKEPSNVISLTELAKLQMQRGETTEALKNIRKAYGNESGNASIRQLYLALEGQYGDRASVIKSRERMLAAGVDGLDNALALVELYELDKRFDDAKRVLDAIEPADPSEQLRIAQAWSVWHARQDQIDEGRAALVAFTNLSPAPSNELMMKAMMLLMQYDINTGHTDQAIETARNAEPYQDPVRREADRSLGDIFLSLNRIDDALQTLERAFVNSSESPGLDLQLAELHLALARQNVETNPSLAAEHRKRAATLLDGNEKAQGPSLRLTLLRGELAFQSGNIAGAEQIFNDAVAKYPQDARVYAARAKFNFTQIVQAHDISRTSRVRADVDQAMQLNPNDTAPLLTLVDLAMSRRDPQTGELNPDVDTIISIWRRILKIEPRNDKIRQMLVQTLFVKGEYTAAQVAIDEAIDLDPTNGAWYEIRGDLDLKTGAPPQNYVGFYLKAFQNQPTANHMAKLAAAMLALKPPQAQKVLQMYQELQSQVGDLPNIRMLVAEAQADLNNQAAALDNLRQAAKQVLLQTDPAARDQLIKDWFDAMAKIVPPNQYASLSQECFGSFDDPWTQGTLGYTLFLGSSKQGVTDPAAMRSAGIDKMAAARARIEAMPASDDRTLRLQREVGWNLADAYYATGDPTKAVDTWRWVLKAAPDHFATLNNLAFVLANDLNDPAAALEPAKQAYEASPADPTMLDTYGYVLFRNNRLDDAERVLRDSLNRKEQSGSRMHLGQVLAAKGKAEDAKRELNRARTIAQQQGDAKRVKDIDELLKNL